MPPDVSLSWNIIFRFVGKESSSILISLNVHGKTDEIRNKFLSSSKYSRVPVFVLQTSPPTVSSYTGLQTEVINSI